MKIKKKIIIGIIVTLLLAPASIYAVPKINNYYQAFKLEKEADKLLAKKDYQAALSSYKKSREKWEDKVINEKITATEQTINDDKNYKEGQEAINAENWDKAIKKFSSISRNSEYYTSAKRLADYAKNKVENSSKENILGNTAINEKKQKKYDKSVKNDYALPSPTLMPIVTQSSSPSPSPIPDESALRASIQIALTKVAEIEGQIKTLELTLSGYNKALLDCLKDARTPPEDAILSPSQYESLRQNCYNLYQNDINSVSNQINSLEYQKEEYARQANELLSRCTTCN